MSAINHDTSAELHVSRFRNGIKVQRPSTDLNHSQSIGDLVKNNFTVYFLNSDGAIQLMNESLADIYNLESPRQGIGKTIFDFSAREKAEEIRLNDFVVMKNEVNFFTEEVVLSKLDEQEIPFLSLKYPWYNDQNKLCGLFGLSIALHQHPLALSLNTIASRGFLFTNKTANHKMVELLSNRELEVMQHLVRGKSAKQIAALFQISFRTIEQHIANIKTKTKISSKSELINTFLEIFS